MKRPLLLSLAFVLSVSAVGGEAAAPPKAADAVAALEKRLSALLKEGTGLEQQDAYEALLAEASAVAAKHADSPALPRAYLVIARCCEALGKHPEKEAAFERYIEALVARSKDGAAQALRREVEALVARRELYSALKVLQLMLGKFPDGEEAAYALYRIGTCQLWLGNEEEAVAPLTEVVQRWPKSDAALEARLRLARAYQGRRAAAEAEALLEQFLQENPDSPRRDDVLFDLALAHYTSRDYYAALVGFQRLIREFPESPYVALAQACIAKLRGDVLNRILD